MKLSNLAFQTCVLFYLAGKLLTFSTKINEHLNIAPGRKK